MNKKYKDFEFPYEDMEMDEDGFTLPGADVEETIDAFKKINEYDNKEKMKNKIN